MSSDEDATDDELPTSSVASLALDPPPDDGRGADDDDHAERRPPPPAAAPAGNDDALRLRRRRAATHDKLRAYEAKRRAAYESKLQSSALYWHAFRTLMHDSVLESRKADLLVRGWA